MISKKELRDEIRKQKWQFTRQQLEEMSLTLIGKLLSHRRMAEANTVMMYCSLPDEVSTREALDKLVERGCKVVLPVVLDGENMELREYHCADELKEGAFHIYEPVGKKFVQYGSIDVAVIPGMSFDVHGNRLGRGKGYYDRFLAKLPDAYKIGLCFDFQKRETIPSEDSDIKMDEVL